jgi:hypothetical protein
MKTLNERLAVMGLVSWARKETDLLRHWLAKFIHKEAVLDFEYNTRINYVRYSFILWHISVYFCHQYIIAKHVLTAAHSHSDMLVLHAVVWRRKDYHRRRAHQSHPLILLLWLWHFEALGYQLVL